MDVLYLLGSGSHRIDECCSRRACHRVATIKRESFGFVCASKQPVSAASLDRLLPDDSSYPSRYRAADEICKRTKFSASFGAVQCNTV